MTLRLGPLENKENTDFISYDVVSSQGQVEIENLSGMKSVKVHETVCNTGNK